MDPVYISHGSPMLPLEDIAARDFLRQWKTYLPEKPKAIVAVSAHWNTSHPSVTVTPRNTTIHDFYGFPPDLYKPANIMSFCFGGTMYLARCGCGQGPANCT